MCTRGKEKVKRKRWHWGEGESEGGERKNDRSREGGRGGQGGNYVSTRALTSLVPRSISAFLSLTYTERSQSWDKAKLGVINLFSNCTPLYYYYYVPVPLRCALVSGGRSTV